MVRRELTTELRLIYKQNFINAKFNGDKSLYDKYMSEKVLQTYYAKKNNNPPSEKVRGRPRKYLIDEKPNEKSDEKSDELKQALLIIMKYIK